MIPMVCCMGPGSLTVYGEENGNGELTLFEKFCLYFALILGGKA